MRKPETDRILDNMLQTHGNVSDLNFTADKPLQVESSGQLVSVPMNPPIDKLTPFQTEIFSLNLINQDRRLLHTLLKEGFIKKRCFTRKDFTKKLLVY